MGFLGAGEAGADPVDPVEEFLCGEGFGALGEGGMAMI